MVYNMKLDALKDKIESNTIDYINFLIFKYEDIDFLPNQYLFALSKNLNKDIIFIDNLPISNQKDIFNNKLSVDNIECFKTDIFDVEDVSLIEKKYLIIICKEITENCKDLFNTNIVYFPKLEDWQIKDYVYSVAEGVDTKYLDALIYLCHNDIYKIDNELAKIKIFERNQRNILFKSFIEEGLFNDLNNNTIFDISNAILRKDINKLTELLINIDKIDCEPLGLVTILYKSIKDIINIQLNHNATPENTDINKNRFWAIKKNNCGFFTKDQLFNIFKFITSIDKKLKTGEISVDIIVDYIVCKILSF